MVSHALDFPDALFVMLMQFNILLLSFVFPANGQQIQRFDQTWVQDCSATVLFYQGAHNVWDVSLFGMLMLILNMPKCMNSLRIAVVIF